MKTKQFISLAIVCLMAMTLGSCAEVELLTFAKNMNKKCPVKMANGNEMTSVEFEDNTLTFCYTQDIADEDIADFEGNKDLLKRTMLAGIGIAKSKNKDNDDDLLDMIIKANASLRFVIKQKSSDKEVASIELTKEDIEEFLNAPELSADDHLRQMLDAVNSELPEQLGEGLVQEKLILEDQTLIVLHKVDEIASLEELEKVKVEMKKTLIMSCLSNGFFHIVIDTGRDIIFRYESTNGEKTVDIVLENSILAEGLKEQRKEIGK